MDKPLSDETQSLSGSESSGSSSARPRRLGRGRAKCVSSENSVRRPGQETLSGSDKMPVTKSDSDSRLGENSNTNSPSNDGRMRSSLRVNAAEFVPRSFSVRPPAGPSVPPVLPPPNQQQQQCPPSSSSSSAAQPPTMPRRRRVSSNSYHFNENVAIEYLEETLEKLVLNPGSFVELVDPLVEVLNGWVDDNETLSLIVDVIFHKAVSEPNFHWTGAKLCGHLAGHLTVSHEGGSNFRQHLLKRCHDEHKLRDSFIRTTEGNKRLHGFALFLAELFLSMEVNPSGAGVAQRVHILRGALVQLVQTLFTKPTDDNLKTIVKVLKLAGGVLEDCERSERRDTMAVDMDNTFQLIKDCIQVPTLSENVRLMLYSVIELRSTNWGRLEAVPEPPPPPPAFGTPTTTSAVPGYMESGGGALIQAGPVFYGNNGMPITAQEAGYMSELDYIQQLQWGEDYASFASGAMNGSSGENALYRQAPAQNQGRPLLGQPRYEGNGPYDNFGAVGNDMWSANEEMTDDMIEAFEQFMLENRTNPGAGDFGSGNGERFGRGL